MIRSTADQLIDAASQLLDRGGSTAVTLRAVAGIVGVSHNAPYRHFKDRSALLAAVAIQDFAMLTKNFMEVRRTRVKPISKLQRALNLFATYGLKYPARYRLLFNEPEIAVQGGELEAAALRCFCEFAGIVGECQASNAIPQMPTVALTGLIYASAHGLIDLSAGGRLRKEKGFASVAEGLSLLLDLLAGKHRVG